MYRTETDIEVQAEEAICWKQHEWQKLLEMAEKSTKLGRNYFKFHGFNPPVEFCGDDKFHMKLITPEVGSNRPGYWLVSW